MDRRLSAGAQRTATGIGGILTNDTIICQNKGICQNVHAVYVF